MPRQQQRKSLRGNPTPNGPEEMSSSCANARYVVQGPKGFLTFTESADLAWGPEVNAWRFLTIERATMVLYELGIVQGEGYQIKPLHL